MKQQDRMPWLVALILLVAAGTYVQSSSGPGATDGMRSTGVAVSLPIQIQEWRCLPLSATQESYHDASAEQSWAGLCKKEQGQPLEVYVGYVSIQQPGRRLQSPALKFGSGYSGKQNIQVGDSITNGDPINLCQVLFEPSGKGRLAVSFWYQMTGKSYSSEYRYRWALLLQRLMMRTTAAAIVRIAGPVVSETVVPVWKEQQQLAQALHPEISKILR